MNFFARSIPALLCLAAILPGCARGPSQAPQASASPRTSPAVISPSPADPLPIQTEAWEFAGNPGHLIRTPSYRIFTTETDPVLLDQLPRFLEASLARYTTAFGPLPRPRFRLDTYLMREQSEWAALTTQLMGDRAPTFLRIERGGFASGGRAILRSIGRRDTLAIAAHEGWHQYTQRTFKQELPAWLEEGIAVSMEGFFFDPDAPSRPVLNPWANTERYDQLAFASERGQLRPLHDLITTSPQSLINASTSGTLTYYAQLWSIMAFLNEGGQGGRHRRGLQNAVNAAATGTLRSHLESRFGRQATALSLGPDTLAAYIADDFVAFESEWSQFVADMLRPGVRDSIVQGRSPLTPDPAR